MASIGNFYNGVDQTVANDYMPLVPCREIRRVINPIGLPVGTYIIWMDVANPTDLLSISQFALEVGPNAYYVRTPSAFPNIWNPWTLINTGAGGPFQPLSASLTALAALAGVGYVIQTGPNTFVDGTITAGDAAVTITNPAGPNTMVDVSAALQAISTLLSAAGTGYLFQTGAGTIVDGTITGGANGITTTLNAVTGQTQINLPAGVVNDVLEYNGAAWVTSSSWGVGNSSVFNMNTIGELTPLTPIAGAVALALTGDASGAGSGQMYVFGSALNPVGVNNGEFIINNDSVPFNNPNSSVLLVQARASTSFGGSTALITARNNAAGAPDVNNVVFSVLGDGECQANSFVVYSSTEFKKAKAPLSIDSHKLKDISPITFVYENENDDAPRRACCTYEDMSKLSGEAVRLNRGQKAVDISGGLGVSMSIMKHLEERISALEIALANKA
jgi:hypothetical protein